MVKIPPGGHLAHGYSEAFSFKGINDFNILKFFLFFQALMTVRGQFISVFLFPNGPQNLCFKAIFEVKF